MATAKLSPVRLAHKQQLPPDPPDLLRKPMREIWEIKVGSVWVGSGGERVMVREVNDKSLDVKAAALSNGDERTFDYWAFQCLYDLKGDLG
jgi:hypothetical protein